MRKLVPLLFIVLFTLSIYAENSDNSDLWPDEISNESVEILIYQPQLENYNQITLSARSAISVKYNDKIFFGALWFKGNTAIDKEERLVQINSVEIKDMRFLDEAEEGLKEKIINSLNNWSPQMSLESIIADLDLLINEKEFSEKLKNDPPKIIFKNTPAVLVVIDGEPIIKSVDGSSYEYVLNTPFFIVTKKQKTFYLNADNFWYSSESVLTGWKHTASVPQDIVSLLKRKEKDVATNTIEEMIVPEIIVATTPSELISTNGKPDFASIQGTRLLYLKNSGSNVLLDRSSMKYYFLVSGRWFTSESLKSNDWTFVPGDSLPEDFARIPKDSDIAEVRVSVAGTEEAKESVLESQIPQTAEIDRKTSTTKVSYDGEPLFRIIENTSVSYALNSDKTVLRINSRYYCVDDGVWYLSDNFNGPWEVATSVPSEIYSIPPSEPVYNVRYVYIYDYTPHKVIVGYLPGYLGSYAYHGCILYGTGYYYEPWHDHYFYPRPWTYGHKVYYHPFYGWVIYYTYPYYWYSYYPYQNYHYTYHKPEWKKKRPPFPFKKPGHKFNGKKVYSKKPFPGFAPLKKKIKPKPNNLFVDQKGEVYKKEKDWFKWSSKNWSKHKNDDSNLQKNPKKKFPIGLKDYSKSREEGNYKAKKYSIGPVENNNNEQNKPFKKKFKRKK